MTLNIVGALMAFGAIAAIVQWLLSHRGGKSQEAVRAWYERRFVPYAFQMSLPNAPAWFVGYALLASVVAIPGSASGWMMLAVIDAFAFAMIVSFFRPDAFLPSWLRREVATGEVRRATPDALDWTYFWLIVPGALAMNLIIPYLESISNR